MRNLTGYRFWSEYAKSLQSETEPDLMREFSQNLDTEFTVMNAKPFKERAKEPIIRGTTAQEKLTSCFTKIHKDPIPFNSCESAKQHMLECLMGRLKECFNVSNLWVVLIL